MARMPSTLSHQFSRIPSANIPRSSFNRSSGYKTTINAGWLYPVFVDEGLPADSFSARWTGFGRMSTPQHPIMDNLFMSTFWFGVPNRILWSNWEKFNGSQDNPGDSTDYLLPQVPSPAGGWENGSVGDYFGLPTDVDITVSALPFRAMNLIWNEWFRDENLQDSLPVPLGDGPDDPADYVLQRRGKRHDYFSSALPFPQKGPSVEMPLGDTAPIIGIGIDQAITGTDPMETVNYRETGGITPVTPDSGWTTDLTEFVILEDDNNPNFPGIYADLTSATAATINSLRQAWQYQKLLERDARGGTRYTEILRSHFGVISPDARLQRPEYLGGGVQAVQIAPVANTAGDPQGQSESFVGDLGAIGTTVIDGHGFSKSFTEHMTIIGFVCLHADLNYQQGIDRMWSRRTRFDFYWPSFSHLGEMAILNKEIFVSGDPEIDDDVFGYQEIFAEYRYRQSKVTGQFRSNFAETLDSWHLAQDFASLPQLNEEFIVEDPPVDRVVAVSSYPHFILDTWVELRCARPMPIYSVPGLVDHF